MVNHTSILTYNAVIDDVGHVIRQGKSGGYLSYCKNQQKNQKPQIRFEVFQQFSHTGKDHLHRTEIAKSKTNRFIKGKNLAVWSSHLRGFRCCSLSKMFLQIVRN